MKKSPLGYEVREDIAQPDNQVGCTQVPLVHGVEVLPRRGTGEELVLLGARLRPGDAIL
jgi:hypothetical protein